MPRRTTAGCGQVGLGAVRYINYDLSCGRPLTLPSRALQSSGPTVVYAFDGGYTAHPCHLRPTDEIIIAWFGRVQGAALVAVRSQKFSRGKRTPPNPAQPRPAAVGIQSLLVRLTVVWRTAPNPAQPRTAAVGIQSLLVRLTVVWRTAPNPAQPRPAAVGSNRCLCV